MVRASKARSDPGSHRRWRPRLLALGGVVVILVGAAFLAIRVGRDDLREFSRFRERVPLARMAACRCLPDRDLVFDRPDGVRIAASIYGDRIDPAAPWVVLVHGNTPVGRRLGLYRVLASRLAERGKRVLTLDQSGFGESGDPFAPGTLEALDRRLDVLAALDQLTEREHLGDAPVYLVGHSGGAAAVFRAGISDPRVTGLVAIGPPRRMRERLADAEDRDYFWSRARRTRRLHTGTDFPAWFNRAAWLELGLRDAMEHQLDDFSAVGHKPLLLIDGERESEADRTYLRRYFESIAEPKAYVTLAGSNHYCNVKGFAGGRLIVYDRRVVAEAVERIDRWIDGRR